MSINNRQLVLIYIPCSLLVSFLLYSLSFNGPFMLDDYTHIVYNESIRLNNLDLDSLIKSTSSYSSRPLSMISIAINYHFSQLDPYWYKVTNYALHFINSLIIALISYLLLSHYGTGNKNHYKIMALTISFIWLILPINISTVSYVIQRMTIGSSTFILLTLLSYIHLRKSHKLNSTSIALHIICMLLFFITSMLFKEIGVLSFIYIALLELCVFFDFKKYKHTIINYRSMLSLIIIASILICYLVTFSKVMNVYDNRAFTLVERLLTQSRMIIEYIVNTYIPLIDNLNIYNDHINISQSLFDPLTTFASISFLFMSLLVTLIGNEKYKIVALGYLLFLSSHLIESTVLPLEIYYEHRNYLSSFGLIMMATIIVNKTTFTHAFKIIIAIAYIAYLASTLAARSNYWSNADLFHNNQLRKQPDSYRAHYYSAIHMIETNGDKKSLETQLRTASSLKTDQVHTLILLLEQVSDNRYNEIKPQIAVEIINRLRYKKILEFDIANMSKSYFRIQNGNNNIDLNTFISFIKALTVNQTTEKKIRYWAIMFMANHLTKNMNDCTNGLSYSQKAYDYYINEGHKESLNSYIPETHMFLSKLCK